MSGSDGPAQQLAGLFAGGMPTLKKTGGPGRESPSLLSN
jgi:hypothetical protein